MSGYEELIASKGTETPAVEAPPVVDIAPEPAPVVSDSAPSEVQAPLVVETPPAAAAEPQVQAEPQDPMAPVKALLDERDRRQAAERKAQAVEQQLQAIRAREAEAARKAQEAADDIPHPLDDPDGFKVGLRRHTDTAVRAAVQQVQTQHVRQIETLSRNMLLRHVGAEKVKAVEEFSRTAPKRVIDEAYASGDPYGAMYDWFEKAEAHKRNAAALEQLGGKTLEERIAEAVAAERSKWEAEHGGGQLQPAAQPAPVDTRARNPDGTFASTSANQTQRHQPPSLSVVAAAPAPRGEEARGGYEQLFKRG